MADPVPRLDENSAGERTAAMAARVRGTNINERSLLATDYLNHFNEVVMMLELVPQMPECLDELKAWEPKPYKAHFRDSALHDRELAMEAYDCSPPACRAAFEATVGRLNEAVGAAIAAVEAALRNGPPGEREAISAAAVREVRGLIDLASALINGEMPTTRQREIDVLLRL